MKKTILLLTVVLFATTIFAQLPNYVSTTGLIGWWPFTGNANDYSPNANNGIVNGASLTSDRFGNPNCAYYFSNTNDSIGLPTINCNNILKYSVTGWFKKNINSVNIEGTVFAQSNCCNNADGLRFFIGGNNLAIWTVEFTSGGCQAKSKYQPIYNYSDGLWHFFAATFDGIPGIINTNQLNFYIDNVMVTQLADSGTNQNVVIAPIINTSFSTVIGNVSSGGDRFIGSLDDFGVWNRVLTQQEITILFHGCNLSITTQPTDQSNYPGNNVQFTIATSNSSASYQWENNSGSGWQPCSNYGQFTGATNDTLIVSNITSANNNQAFRCIVTYGPCIDTSDIAIIKVLTGFKEISIQNQFKVYPNPTSNILYVETNTSLIGSHYSIIDQFGKTVLTGKINSVKSTIEIGRLTYGIYWLKVGLYKQDFKIVKAK